MIRWIEKGFASKESIDNTEKLMDYCHDSLFIGFPLSSFFKKIIFKELIYPYNGDSHKVKHSSKASITSFRYSSFSFKLSGLIDSWINSSVSDEFFCGGELFYIFDFSYKMRGCYIIETFNRFKDFKLIGMIGFTFFDEDMFDSFKFFLQNEESSDFTFKNFFMDRGSDADRIFCGFKDFVDRENTFSSFFLLREDFNDFIVRCFKECVFRWEGEEELEGGESEWVYDGEEFREEDMDEAFNFIFQGDDFLRDSLSFSCEGSEVLRRLELLGKIICMDSQKFSYNGGIFPIGFSFSQGESREIRDEERIKHNGVEVMGVKEREKIYVIGAGGFHCYDDFIGIRACGFNGVKEGIKTFGVHKELRGEERFPVFINQSGMKRVFRDIDATEKGKHGYTSLRSFYEAGEASKSILHSDEGSLTQSTYEDLRRQVTNSFEGSKTQVKWSSPASCLLSYQAYKFININLS